MPGKRFEGQSRGTANSNTWALDTDKDYGTPPYIEAILRVFPKLDLDPCSNEYSLVPAAQKWSLPEQDGLVLPWPVGHIYVNPPYGRDALRGTHISDWLWKAYEAASRGAEVLALIPVATNTQHWKDYVFKATKICFLADTRLRFYVRGVELKKGAPMACAVPYWGSKCTEQFVAVFSQYGTVVSPIGEASAEHDLFKLAVSHDQEGT